MKRFQKHPLAAAIGMLFPPPHSEAAEPAPLVLPEIAVEATPKNEPATGTQIETAIRDTVCECGEGRSHRSTGAFSPRAALKKMISPKLKPIASVIQATFVGFAFATGTAVFARSAHAQDEPGAELSKKRYRIPAGPLGPALSRFAAETDVLLSFDPALTEGRTTPGLFGDYSVAEAFAGLLSASGLQAVKSGAGYTLQALPPRASPPAGTPPARREEDTASGVTRLETTTAAGEELQILPEITVTASPTSDDGFKAEFQTSATKTPLPIRETPQSVSVVTQDSLEARQVVDLGQALETAAGVALYSGPGPFAGQDFGLGAIQIRGFNTDFLTDVRQDGFVSPIFAAQPDLAPYERIEVVKGPSSLYGRGSAGGFVNRVTKKPLPFFQADVEGSVGSFDFYRVEGDVTGPLFHTDRARGCLVLAYQDSGSFIDSLESERVVVAPSLEFDLTDRTRLLLQGIYQDDQFIINPGIPLQRFGDEFRAPDIRRSLFIGVPTDDESTTEILSASLQLEHQLDDNWLATLRLARGATEHRAQTDNYGFGLQPNGDIGLYSSAFRIDNDVWAGELRLEGSLELLDRPATVVLGVDHTEVENINDQFFGVLGTANIYEENFADFPTVEPVRSYTGVFKQPSTGGYAQLQFRPLDRLSVLLGGRYDSAETSNEEWVGGTEAERDDEEFTGRAGLVFDVAETTSVYALYAQSFQPALFDVGRDGQLLESQEGEIYEGGVKTEWLAGRLGVNAAIFRIERDNVPVTAQTLPGEMPFSIPAGLQRSDGFELEINGEPLPGWNLSFAGSLLDTEFSEQEGTPFGVADWRLGLFTSYELQGGLLRGLGLGAGLFAIDDRGVGTAFPDAKLEGYERVDLHAFYNGFNPFKIRLLVRNVFDERYVEGSDRIGGYNQFGAPTAVLLTVRYDFE